MWNDIVCTSHEQLTSTPAPSLMREVDSWLSDLGVNSGVSEMPLGSSVTESPVGKTSCRISITSCSQERMSIINTCKIDRLQYMYVYCNWPCVCVWFVKIMFALICYGVLFLIVCQCANVQMCANDSARRSIILLLAESLAHIIIIILFTVMLSQSGC